jgi:hypothetical protein
MKNKQYQVQSSKDVVLSSSPLVVGRLVYFTGTLEECLGHKISWDKDYPDTAYKARVTSIVEA